MPTLQSKLWHWTDAQPEPGFVEKWRTPARTRALIVTYFTALFAGIGLEIGALWNVHLLWPAVAGLLVAMTAWTMLRNTIRSKDSAPREMLDDYENQVLDLWRSRALSIISVMLFTGGAAFILIAVGFADTLEVGPFGAVAGLYLIFTYLAVTTLPAVGYALTFNRPVDKE